MNGPTTELAEWVSSLRYSDLPSNVVSTAKAVLLDGLGCGLYGSRTLWAGIVADWVTAKEGVEQAMVFGRNGLRFPVANAALANGVAIHSFELDDYHNAKIHPGAVVIAAALPVAQN